MIDDPHIASVPIEDRWIDEAAQELHGYPCTPFVKEFMTRNGLAPGAFATVSECMEEIAKRIRSPDHPLRLDDLVAYLAELKAYGRQFVRLWSIKAGEEAYLASLRDRATIDGIVARAPVGQLNQRRLVWESADPELVEIHHGPSTSRHLLQFEWVATRRYFVLVGQADPAAPPQPVQCHRRAVTFLRLDLDGGACELRIQGLPHGGQGLPSQEQEVVRYCAEVEKYIDLSRFTPVLIETVAKRWLREPPLQVRNWRVIRPDGSYLAGGGRGRTVFPKLSVLLGEFFARDLTMKWTCAQRVVHKSLFFSLDGHGDIVDFNGLADASRVDFTLDQIRSSPPAKLVMKELRSLAARYPEHARILAALDFHFTVQSRLRVTLKELTDELWYQPEAIRAVTGLVAREVPSRFSLTGKDGDVLEIDNRLRLSEGGLVEKLRRKADGEGDDQTKALVEPALSVGWLLVLLLVGVLVDWLVPVLFEELTGIPFILVQVALVFFLGLALAAITFGGRAVGQLFGRLVASLRSVVRWLHLLRAGIGVPSFVKVLDAMYERWLAVARQAGRTWSLEHAAPTRPAT